MYTENRGSMNKVLVFVNTVKGQFIGLGTVLLSIL